MKEFGAHGWIFASGMTDRLVTATAANGMISLVAGITTDLVADVQIRHRMAPTPSAAVGRLITGGALLGARLKGRERLTLQIVGDGPIGALTADVVAVSPRTVGVRGNARNPDADVPLNDRGKFDVGRVVGNGRMQVTKSYEVGQPYMGVVSLINGEIGDDLASYLMNSQQIPNVVALGVLANPTGIIAAGGIIAQVMPGADESLIGSVEANAAKMSPVTTQINAGGTPESLLEGLIDDGSLKIYQEYDVAFACWCTREKVEVALLGLGRDELVKIATEQPQTEATCEFCKRTYVLSRDDVADLVSRIDAG